MDKQPQSLPDDPMADPGTDDLEGDNVREGIDFVQTEAHPNRRLVDAHAQRPADQIHEYGDRATGSRP